MTSPYERSIIGKVHSLYEQPLPYRGAYREDRDIKESVMPLALNIAVESSVFVVASVAAALFVPLFFPPLASVTLSWIVARYTVVKIDNSNPRKLDLVKRVAYTIIRKAKIVVALASVSLIALPIIALSIHIPAVTVAALSVSVVIGASMGALYGVYKGIFVKGA